MTPLKQFASIAACVLFAAAAPALRAADATAKAPEPAQQAPKFKVKVLARAEFDALLAKPDEVVLIDVRRPDEITKNGGFPAYLSIQSKDLENRLAFIPKDRTIVTVSNHAARAGLAGDLLVAKGFKVAGAVGAQTYEEQGGSLTRIVPPEPKPASASN